MTTGKVIEDHDDLHIRKWQRTKENAGFEPGTTWEGMDNWNGHRETPAPLPWQGRHRGQEDVPKDVPGAPLPPKLMSPFFSSGISWRNGIWTFKYARVYFLWFLPPENEQSWSKHDESSFPPLNFCMGLSRLDFNALMFYVQNFVHLMPPCNSGAHYYCCWHYLLKS